MSEYDFLGALDAKKITAANNKKVIERVEDYVSSVLEKVKQRAEDGKSDYTTSVEINKYEDIKVSLERLEYVVVEKEIVPETTQFDTVEWQHFRVVWA